VRRALEFVAALAVFLALWSLRGWYVVVGAFFGVVMVRAAYRLAHDHEWVDAILAGALGVALLVVSYRWFAIRWRAERPSPPPAA
jgi:hypothetical protein